MKIFKKIKKPNGRRHIYFCGIKIFSYKKRSTSRNLTENTYLWQMLRTTALHSQVFPKFKNMYAGKDIVIVATGPSVKNFVPIKNAIYIGVNKSFKLDNITLDYLFMQDYIAVKDYINDSVPYKNQSLIRFYGITPASKLNGFMIPEAIAIRHKALRYYAHTSFSDTPELPDTFAYDLASEELYGKRSIIFPAIQFALWTNPKRIYLVGCDCSNAGHFDSKDKFVNCESLKEPYVRLKKFITDYYPETEIISVNPVGLKGLFTDLNQTKEK